MRFSCIVLAIAIAAVPVLAQDRRAIVRLRIDDRALAKAKDLRRQGAPDAELRKLAVHQPYTLVLSGVVISPNEIVTTALHPKAQLRILVTCHDGSKLEGRLVGTDPRSNLAIVRVTKDLEHYLDLAVCPVASRQAIRLLGHIKEAEECTASDGAVVRERMPVSLRDFFCVNEGRPIKLGSVFMVAEPQGKLNPGSAGFVDGKLAGIVIGSLPPRPIEGVKVNPPLPVYHVTFLMPTERVMRVVKHIRAHGKVIRSYYGVSLLPVDPRLRAHFDVPASASAVLKVEAGTPASAAGLRTDDVVLTVDGKSYANTYEMGEAMGDKQPGTSVTLEILRSGKKIKVDVLPVERE